MREEGFYWVTVDSEHKDFQTGRSVVAEFGGYGWQIPGMLYVFYDDEVTVLEGPIPEPVPSAAFHHQADPRRIR